MCDEFMSAALPAVMALAKSHRARARRLRRSTAIRSLPCPPVAFTGAM